MTRKPSAPAPPLAAEPSLADELARLEQIVRRLEAEDIDLDAVLALFEEGVRHLRTARERLGDAELTVRTVLEDAGGALRLSERDG